MSDVEEVVQPKGDEVYSNKIAIVQTSKFNVKNQNTTTTKNEKNVEANMFEKMPPNLVKVVKMILSQYLFLRAQKGQENGEIEMKRKIFKIFDFLDDPESLKWSQNLVFMNYLKRMKNVSFLRQKKKKRKCLMRSEVRNC